jgi:hypothetical protein
MDTKYLLKEFAIDTVTQSLIQNQNNEFIVATVVTDKLSALLKGVEAVGNCK